MKTKVKIGQGRGIFDFALEGEAVIVDEPQKYIGKCREKIVVVKSPTPEIYLLMKECLGVVSQTGGIVSHLAIIGMDMGVPTIVGVDGLMEKVCAGDILYLTSENGHGGIYEIK